MYVNNSSPDDHGHQHLQKKKRVGKACDSCRIKKTKCDGKKPCNKCIQDNKICVFTEKKKVKDKSYPSGYVELLEARLDLLTRSFEKMIQLSAPGLPFVKELVMQENPDLLESDLTRLDQLDDVFIPINKTINHLISEQNLLNNSPLEWENGALIAANFNKDDIEADSSKFAAHKASLQDANGDDEGYDNGGSRRNTYQYSQNVQVKQEPTELDNLDDFKDEFDEVNENLNMGFLPNINNFPLNGYTSGGFVLANSATLNDGLSNDLSDFESDSNSIYSQSNPPAVSRQHSGSQPLSPRLESFKPPSLFTHSSSSNGISKNESDFFNHGNHSLSSLTHRTDSHKLNSPTNISPSSTFESQVSQGSHTINNGSSYSTQEDYSDSLISPNGQRPQAIRRTSSFATRSRSPSHQRLKSIGHIHKPVHTHHHGSHIGLNGTLQKPAEKEVGANGEGPDQPAVGLSLENDLSLPSDTIAMADTEFDNNLYGL